MLVIQRVPLQLLQQIAGVHHLQAQMAVVGRARPAASRIARARSLWAKALLPVTTSTRPSALDAARAACRRVERAGHHVEAPARAPCSVMLSDTSTPTALIPRPRAARAGCRRCSRTRRPAGVKRSTSHAGVGVEVATSGSTVLDANE